MKIKAIITGTTGMVGEGVLHECLQHPDVERILVINRRPCGVTNPKLKEIIHNDFFNFSAIKDQLQGYNACFFCLGVSSVGMKEEDFTKFTYTLTMHVATTLVKYNPEMIFCYISGAGTDRKMMWARVKKKTEDDLMQLPFKKVYAFRPGIMKPIKGLKNTLTAYKYLGWLFPIIKLLSPNSASTLKELGDAMINVVLKGYDKNVLEVKDIILIAKK